MILKQLENVLDKINLEQKRFGELEEKTKAAHALYYQFKEAFKPKMSNVCDKKFKATTLYRFSDDFLVVEYPGNKVAFFSAEGLTMLKEHEYSKEYLNCALKIETDHPFLILGFKNTLILTDGSNDLNNKFQIKNTLNLGQNAQVNSLISILNGNYILCAAD